ncbi:MAG: PQQ-like beta-propeller repeat protein [Saprospiraceae bacterium]|nr:PQQ-like beta-propeller repeat protein [Saprospiraceae bacterium]MBK7796102.1 PQQ-like beta-propeller repeat protein [Saprospiraceae bacterium]MBL0261186.1 PQQ-like beta-propeller repeat protein [Saprospiraceae bacterium]
MKKIIAIIFSGLFLGCGCNKEELPSRILDNGVVIEKPYIWWNKGNLEHLNELWEVKTFDFNVIKELVTDDKNYLASYKLTDGKLNWKWNDYWNNDFQFLGEPYQINNLYIDKVNKNTYCIDLFTGKTVWKIARNSEGNWINSGFNDNYIEIMYGSNKINGFSAHSIYVGKTDSPNFYKEIIPKYFVSKNLTVNDEVGICCKPNGFQKDGKEMIFIPFYCPNSINDGKRYISLYNLSDDRWVYDSILISEKSKLGMSLLPLFYNDLVIINIDQSLYAINVMKGEIIWETKFNQNSSFGFGGFIIDNGTLYCAAEGDGYYALDAETGAIKWKGERAPGTSSRMVVLNGVLYYINGGDGRLWALDAATGKTLWRLKSPDGYSFKREINVMQGDGERKGYVLTSTWHGACAYEAER